MRNKGYKDFIFVIFFCLVFACQKEEIALNKPLFERLDMEVTGITFVNNLRESAQQNVLTYEYYYNGAGLAIADFNQDELPDIYFVSNLEPNRFYLNQGNLSFKDVTKAVNLGGKRGFYTGVATVDINADGLLDLYVCKSGRFDNPDLRRNELYINQGIGKDNLPIFKESAKSYGLDIPAYSTQASFFDYDKDGDLDLFLINHEIDTYLDEDIAQLQKEPGELAGERLFRNDDGYFKDITYAAGLINNKLGYGLGIGVGDLNNDLWPDVYISNDYSGKDHLYINQQNGTFSEVVDSLTRHISFYSMGNDIGDINNDGWQDIVNLDMVAKDNYGIKTSMSAMNPAQFQRLVSLGLQHQYMFNTLLLNNGVSQPGQLPQFSDIGQMLGISNTDWSWAPLLFDFDNDGLKDLFISNGIKRNIRNNDAVKAIKEIDKQIAQVKSQVKKAAYFEQMLKLLPYHRKPNFFFLNKGDLHFDNISTALGIDTLPTASNGSAYADLDLDGDLDLVINNVGEPAMVFKNNSRETKAANYLQISLKGPKGNPFGIGTKVSLKYKDGIQIGEQFMVRGYLSAIEPILHFGLGSLDRVEELTVYWPNGKAQQMTNVKANQRLKLEYKETSTKILANSSKQAIFEDLSERLGIKHQHQENDFNDFARESLLPHKMSQIGPALAVGDLSGDGVSDFFIGGAKGQAATLYLQDQDGRMRQSLQSLWQEESQYEDVTAILLDADGDSDLDLIVGSGGNEAKPGHSSYQLRLYENKGEGKLIKNTTALPAIFESLGVIKEYDFDQDGDLDLFIGGRQIPGKYPYPANSYLLRNDSKTEKIKFVDITADAAPFLKAIGMVTDAIWLDVDNDERMDLITVGEWMTPKVFLNREDQFIDQTEAANFSDEVGWWNSIVGGDFDKDGDIDLVAGNIGLNYKYKTNRTEPFEVYANDFDENGSVDIVLGYHDGGDLFPLRGRECSSNQMPFIKVKFPTYDAFGKATLKEVYGEAQLKSSVHYRAQNFASTYFENDGNGKFVGTPLPNLAQISSINDMFVQDFNQDGYLDLLIAGNMYGSEVETPRSDASIGQLLRGNGQGDFKVIPAYESGLQIIGEVKHLKAFEWIGEEKRVILVAKNNDALQIIGY